MKYLIVATKAQSAPLYYTGFNREVSRYPAEAYVFTEMEPALYIANVFNSGSDGTGYTWWVRNVPQEAANAE